MLLLLYVEQVGRLFNAKQLLYTDLAFNKDGIYFIPYTLVKLVQPLVNPP